MLRSQIPPESPGLAALDARRREVERLLEEVRRQSTVDLPGSLGLAEQAVELAAATEATQLIAALIRRAGVNLRLLNFRPAEQDLERARDLCVTHDHDAPVGLIEMQFGTLRWYQGETTRAYAHYRAALDGATRHGDLRTAASCHNNLGLVYTRTGDYLAALEEQLVALEHFRTLGDPGMEAITRLNVGVSFYWLGRHAEAIEMLEQIIAQFEGTPHVDLVTRARLNLGATYASLRDYRRAEVLLRQAMEHSRAHALNLDGSVLRELGQAYLADPARASREEALAAFEQSLAFCREHHDPEGEVQALNFLGETLAQLGRVDDALRSHQQALDLALNGDFHNDATVAHRHLALLHKARGADRRALHHLREQTRLEHKRLQEQAEQRSQLLMVRYRTEQALRQAQLAAKESELQRLRNDELARALQALERADRDRQVLLQQLAHQAQHDQLTGLANRALYHTRVQQAVEHARAHAHRTSVLFVDLDGFKLINDTLGHHAGDRLLQEIAARLLACVTPADTVARMGGDEFTVVLARHTDAEHAGHVARQVLRAVSAPVTLEGRTVRVTGSVGIAVYPDDGADAETLQRHADAAMYAAKHDGRNAARRHAGRGPSAADG